LREFVSWKACGFAIDKPSAAPPKITEFCIFVEVGEPAELSEVTLEVMEEFVATMESKRSSKVGVGPDAASEVGA
jgi:hypothetical protein